MFGRGCYMNAPGPLTATLCEKRERSLHQNTFKFPDCETSYEMSGQSGKEINDYYISNIKKNIAKPVITVKYGTALGVSPLARAGNPFFLT